MTAPHLRLSEFTCSLRGVLILNSLLCFPTKVIARRTKEPLGSFSSNALVITQRGYYYHVHFMNKETEEKLIKIICLWSESYKLAGTYHISLKLCLLLHVLKQTAHYLFFILCPVPGRMLGI